MTQEQLADARKRQIDTLRRALGILLEGDPDIPISELEQSAEQFHNKVSTDEIVLPNNGDPNGKRESIFDLALRKWKEQRRRGEGVALDYEMIQAAAGCSKSWAYELMADMADEYDRCHHADNPQRLKIDGELLEEYDRY